MKTKNIICGIAGILATMSAANAVDTAQIKAACQANKKTLWVERNQVCIPRNPCKDSKYEQYCNRDFKDVQIKELGYKVLVEAFARTHNLSCVPVDTKSKLLGQDYVICMGDDVMVFEFDDISEVAIKDELTDRYMLNRYPAVCRAIGGSTLEDNKTACSQVTKADCMTLKEVLEKYNVDAYTNWYEDGNYCRISISRNDADIDNIDREIKQF